MLMKLTSSVNFTNILKAAFTQVDPQSAKNILISCLSLCTFMICALFLSYFLPLLKQASFDGAAFTVAKKSLQPWYPSYACPNP
jgi:hypothetical protein